MSDIGKMQRIHILYHISSTGGRCGPLIFDIFDFLGLMDSWQLTPGNHLRSNFQMCCSSAFFLAAAPLRCAALLLGYFIILCLSFLSAYFNPKTICLYCAAAGSGTAAAAGKYRENSWSSEHKKLFHGFTT